MEVRPFFINQNNPLPIHSISNMPLNISNNPTRLSLDSKKQLLIKGIYKKPSAKSLQKSIVIIQSNLSNTEKKYLSTQATSYENADKPIKSQETPINKEKYPYKIDEMIQRKNKSIVNFAQNQTSEYNAQNTPKKSRNSVTKYKFLSCDTNQCENLNQKCKKEQNPQFYFNASFIQKQNWFHYPKKSITPKRIDFSFFHKTSHSPSNLTQSIVSSPKKNRTSWLSSFSRKSLQKKEEKQKELLMKRNEDNENCGGDLLINKKAGRLFTHNFIDQINQMTSNPEIPPPPLNLNIKQTSLNINQAEKKEEPEKIIEINKNLKDELSSLLNSVEQKYQKLLREEQIFQEYEFQNEEKDNFTRVGDNITENELQVLLQEYAKFEEKSLEKVDKITKRVKFFAKFQKPIRYRLLQISTLVKKSANEILFRQGDFGDMLYVILKGSVNVIVNRRNQNGESTENIVASLYDGSSFGELAMMGANRNTKELKIDLISQIITKSDIYKFIRTEEEEKTFEEKQRQLKEAKIMNYRYKNCKKIIEKLETEINEAYEIKVREGQKRLATIKVQESSYMLIIPRKEFKSIILSLYQVDFEFKLRILKKISFFKECDSASLIPFATYLSIRKVKMGEVILREGSTIQEFFIVAQGRGKV